MKKFLAVILIFLSILCSSCSNNKDYILNEDTFFLVMTNMQYYPEQYLDCNIEYDCFTYELKDIEGQSYMCGVRKCSSGYGCTCGKDTIIGFILEYDGELPEPCKQSEDSNEKTWVHLKGKIKSSEKTKTIIHAYLSSGEIDESKTETIEFLVFTVETCNLIGDYSNLHYYVTK